MKILDNFSKLYNDDRMRRGLEPRENLEFNANKDIDINLQNHIRMVYKYYRNYDSTAPNYTDEIKLKLGQNVSDLEVLSAVQTGYVGNVMGNKVSDRYAYKKSLLTEEEERIIKDVLDNDMIESILYARNNFNNQMIEIINLCNNTDKYDFGYRITSVKQLLNHNFVDAECEVFNVIRGYYISAVKQVNNKLAEISRGVVFQPEKNINDGENDVRRPRLGSVKKIGKYF